MIAAAVNWEILRQIPPVVAVALVMAFSVFMAFHRRR